MIQHGVEGHEATHRVGEHRRWVVAEVPAQLIEVVAEAGEPVGGGRSVRRPAAASVVVEHQREVLLERCQLVDEGVADVVRSAMAHVHRRPTAPPLVAQLDPIRRVERRHRPPFQPNRPVGARPVGSQLQGQRLAQQTACPSQIAGVSTRASCLGGRRQTLRPRLSAGRRSRPSEVGHAISGRGPRRGRGRSRRGPRRGGARTGSTPRTTATGMPSALPMTRSAAPASSSTTATSVTCSSRPSESSVPR